MTALDVSSSQKDVEPTPRPVVCITNLDNDPLHMWRRKDSRALLKSSKRSSLSGRYNVAFVSPRKPVKVEYMLAWVRAQHSNASKLELSSEVHTSQLNSNFS